MCARGVGTTRTIMRPISVISRILPTSISTWKWANRFCHFSNYWPCYRPLVKIYSRRRTTIWWRNKRANWSNIIRLPLKRIWTESSRNGKRSFSFRSLTKSNCWMRWTIAAHCWAKVNESETFMGPCWSINILMRIKGLCQNPDMNKREFAMSFVLKRPFGEMR